MSKSALPRHDAGPYRDTDELAELARGLTRAPLFHEAVISYTDTVIALRTTGPRYINKLLGRDVRFRIVTLSFCLGVRCRIMGPERGPTYAQLVDALKRTLDGSPRVVKTTLDMMHSMGLLSVEAGQQDQRLKIFVPTPALYALVKHWVLGICSHLDKLEPGSNRVERITSDPDTFEQIALNMGHTFIAGEPLTGRVPALSCFFNHECGWPVLNTLARHAMNGTSIPSLGSIARAYQVSKSQVANVISKSVAAGFVVKTNHDTFMATDLLMRHFEEWVSIMFAFMLISSPDGNMIYDTKAAELRQPAEKL